MERDINGVPEEQSRLGSVIDNLYRFFFKSRKQQYVIYAATFLIALSYAIVSDLVFRKPQHDVVIESIVLASILLICLPLAYVSGSLRRADRIETKFHSTESPATVQALGEPSDAFFSYAHTSELTNALRIIQSIEQRQLETQDFIAKVISRIDAGQQHNRSAIEAIARTVGAGQGTHLQEQFDVIAKHLHEAVASGLSVTLEQRNTHLVAILSEAIERHNEDFLRRLSRILEQRSGTSFQIPESNESDLRIKLRRRGYAFDYVPSSR